MSEPLLDLLFYDTTELDGKIERSKEYIRRAWVESDDPSPWGLGWSGGKDSTCALKLVVATLLELPAEQRDKRRLAVVASDTGMENPMIESYLHDQVRLFNEWAHNGGHRFDATIVKRPLKHSFWVLVVGKGYTLPSNGYNRWCTHKYKIMPNDVFYAKVKPSVVMSGLRRGESIRRDGIFDKYSTDDLYMQESSSFYKMLTPIVEFTVEDVWATLMEPLPWGDTEAVKTLYKEATGECGFRNPKGADDPVKACGARFGCWTCPVVTADKSTETMSQSHRWMAPLADFRIDLKRMYGEYEAPMVPGESRADRREFLKVIRAENKQIRDRNRSGYRRGGRHTGREDGGILLVHARKDLLKQLLAIQAEVNRLRAEEGLPSMNLIEDDELQMIHEVWKEDEIKRPYLVTKMPKDENTLMSRTTKAATKQRAGR